MLRRWIVLGCSALLVNVTVADAQGPIGSPDPVTTPIRRVSGSPVAKTTSCRCAST